MAVNEGSMVRAGAPSGLLPELDARSEASAAGHARAVRGMFGRISPTYDLLNRLLSLGIDRRWRQRALDVLAAEVPEGPLLDSCAGTLDLAAALQKRWPGRALLACDFAAEMLLAGRAKVGAGARLLVCDAMRLPFASGSFAGITCGFGLRNLGDPLLGLTEAHRVLAPGGVLVVLEFFRPTRAVTRLFHAIYGRLLLPLAGRIVSGDTEAYAYLSRSMLGFLTRAELEQAMAAAGFERVRGMDLTLGIASIVWGIK
ncbi:MAG: ubiquinone/menaquinone biosynthesis methyltransferase [Polyangiales bacterium]